MSIEQGLYNSALGGSVIPPEKVFKEPFRSKHTKFELERLAHQRLGQSRLATPAGNELFRDGKFNDRNHRREFGHRTVPRRLASADHPKNHNLRGGGHTFVANCSPARRIYIPTGAEFSAE